MKNNKIFVSGLVFALTAAMAFPAAAQDSIEEAEAVAADYQKKIEEAKSAIDELQSQKTELLGDIDDLEGQLVTTISGIKAVNSDLEELEGNIVVTGIKLDAAIEDKRVQHDAMKARIQYIYEKGGEVGWATVFLENGDISSWLNSEEFTQSIYAYDRDQLEKYAEAVSNVEKLQAEQNEQKSQLEAKKHSLAEGEAKLEKLLEEAQGTFDDCEDRIADAEKKADSYQKLLDQQNAAISEMVAAQQAAAAEAAAAAAAAAQQAAYEQAAAYQYTAAEQEYINQTAQTLADQTGYDLETATQAAQAAYVSGNSNYNLTGNGGSSRAQELLAYAEQFLGNPYVYGGNSLTNGVDCSGFVQQVYGAFGIPTSRTSWDIEHDGVEVAYSDVQIGDVICYDGHVGIYAGNGQIINAVDENTGIAMTNADYSEIRTIRRYINE